MKQAHSLPWPIYRECSDESREVLLYEFLFSFRKYTFANPKSVRPGSRWQISEGYWWFVARLLGYYQVSQSRPILWNADSPSSDGEWMLCKHTRQCSCVPHLRKRSEWQLLQYRTRTYDNETDIQCRTIFICEIVDERLWCHIKYTPSFPLRIWEFETLIAQAGSLQHVFWYLECCQ